MRSPWRRKPKVSREHFPCDYTGPSLLWGLKQDTPCRVVGSRAGGHRILTPDMKIWTVARSDVRAVQKAA